MAWLDPIIAREDIHLAYQTYYTHGDSTASPNLPLSAYDTVFQWLDRANEKLLNLGHERVQMGASYLHDMSPGKLLDVGCGNGDFLRKMRGRGWTVEGTDVDPAAATTAMAAHGIKVLVGELAAVGYADASFDAVTVRHVIEHVHDPVGLLRECWRLLKPNGRLVVITPNVASYGHKLYGPHWRGLEPPRHLHLFSKYSLEKAGELAMCGGCKIFSTAQGASYLFLCSEKIKASGRLSLSSLYNILFRFWVWQYQEVSRVRRAADYAGEELVLIADRDNR